MAKAHQYLEPRRDVPIVIETPAGFIKIRKSTSARHRKSLEIELPEGMTAYVGEERAIEHAQYTGVRSDGKLVPLYGLAVPVVDSDGALVGVRTQRTIRLADGATPSQTLRLQA